MSKWMALLKMNMKLLLRNKGFLFFLCITPIVTAMILNLKMDSEIYDNKEEKSNITELETSNSKAVYQGDTSMFIIKVYDASQTELSEYLLNRLAGTGIFSVCRADVTGMTEKEVEEQAKKDAFDDRAGTLLYLKKDFECSVFNGDYEGAIQIYDVSDDDRWELFETEMTDALSQLHALAEATGKNSSQVLKLLQSVEEYMPAKQVVQLRGKEDIELTDSQIHHKSSIGYAFAIITLGFLFCGVYVAHTVIEEQNNKVYTRVMLSKAGRWEYLGSKFLVAFLMSAVQTLLLGACIFVLKDMEFGIPKGSFLLLIFCMGIIFSTISFLLGVIIGDIMSANYAVFALWSISALLSGLYFSLDSASPVLRTISYLMPQRWFMRASEILLAGDKGAFSMVLYITMAYLIVALSVGGIGLKITRREA